MVDHEDDITLHIDGQVSRKYSYVFNTVPMGCPGRMDLSGMNMSVPCETLDQDPLTAIRTLAYDQATKVAIKFSKPWWTTMGKKILHGGVSYTDLPISNVIYPSWNDGPDKAHVIIVSYSWAQDATRMASLITDQSKSAGHFPRDPIVQLCFRDLALLWQDSPSVAEFISMYLGHHALAWSHEPDAAGVFALFAPGQFKNLYPTFLQPQSHSKRLMICGEAISAHHA